MRINNDFHIVNRIFSKIMQELQQFWDQKIKEFCISNRSSGDFIFVSINDEILEKIFENRVGEYLDYKQSYFTAIRAAHVYFDKPHLFPFLRFSIFSYSRFQLIEENDQAFWPNFQDLLVKNQIENIPQARRTLYVQSVIKQVSNICLTNNVIFFKSNIYGSDHTHINVGIIKAHALFSSVDIFNLKKSIYLIGAAYESSLDYLSDFQLIEILEVANLERVKKLFHLNEENKELIWSCLRIWLKSWEPCEEEEIEMTKSNKLVKNKNSKIFLSWIWVLENLNSHNLVMIPGFVTKNILGNEGSIYLSNKSHINLENSFTIGESNYLYFINDYDDNEELYSYELKKKFVHPLAYNSAPVVLRKITNVNYEPLYFFQENKQIVSFGDEKIFLATNETIPELINCKSPRFNIGNNRRVFLYAIRSNFLFDKFKFIKQNDKVNVSISGLSAGIQGQKVFLCRFPIRFNLINLESGILQVFNKNNNEIIIDFMINDEVSFFNNNYFEHKFSTGKYYVRVISNSGDALILNDNKNHIDFEIKEEGRLDSRKNIHFDINAEFSLEFDLTYQRLHFKPNWVYLGNDNSLENNYLGHQFFDFCFKRDNNLDWYIDLNRECFFIYLLSSQINFEDNNLFPDRSLSFQSPISVSFLNKFNIKVRLHAFSRFRVSLNQSFYNTSRFRPDRNIDLWCYCFELIVFDDELLFDYPQLKEGLKFNIVSNNGSGARHHKEILDILFCHTFPFK